jgi:hypothetical protein
VVNLNVAKVTAISEFLAKVPEISIISLSRLIDGGAAIFAPISRNHSSVRLGVTISRPFVRIILRVWLIS